MADVLVETTALDARLASLVSVGEKFIKLAADDRLDDEREVIGDIATAMTNVRTEVNAISRKHDVVERDAKQHKHDRDVARQQAKDAKALLDREVADSRLMMRFMAAGCVAVCLASGFAARWWYRPADAVASVVQIDRAPTSPAAPVTLVPGTNGPVAVPTAHTPPSADANTTPGVIGDYACAFGYGRQPGCPEDVRGVTGQHRSTRTVR